MGDLEGKSLYLICEAYVNTTLCWVSFLNYQYTWKKYVQKGKFVRNYHLG